MKTVVTTLRIAQAGETTLDRVPIIDGTKLVGAFIDGESIALTYRHYESERYGQCMERRRFVVVEGDHVEPDPIKHGTTSLFACRDADARKHGFARLQELRSIHAQARAAMRDGARAVRVEISKKLWDALCAWRAESAEALPVMCDNLAAESVLRAAAEADALAERDQPASGPWQGCAYCGRKAWPHLHDCPQQGDTDVFAKASA